MKQLAELLSASPVFRSSPEAERDELVHLAVRRKLEKGSHLAMQGEYWPHLFLVAEGELAAVKTSGEGRNLMIASFGEGELFWGPTFFLADVPLLATLEARSPSAVYLWSRSTVEPILVRNGQISWMLCCLMIQRMQRASAIVEELAFQPVAGRLARLLLDHFTNAGETSITRSLTLDEMAARVGSTREMVCRALYRFADKKLIDVTRTEFVLTDRDGLARMADGS
jgi:CRP/FNR family cyclic AMP-dependent transcriptional regulator